ncbi:MAG: 4-phosphopantetheinyl transferase [Chloroflexota bacterium]|nr:4-phosphopantetheinyl transferase [Chloroflexota bacterium]
MVRFVPQHMAGFSAQFEQLLAPHEQQRLARLSDAHARSEFVVCRGVLHLLLAALSGAAPQALDIRVDSAGKPHLSTEALTHPLEFNLAHTDGLCLIALSQDLEVGVDVERVRDLPELEVMARKYLAPRELAQWQAAPAAQRTTLFYRFWSAKEALLKAFGSGLRIPPAQVDTLDVLDGKALSGRQDDGQYFALEACRLQALPLPPEYSAWLALCGWPQPVKGFELSVQGVKDYLLLAGKKVE